MTWAHQLGCQAVGPTRTGTIAMGDSPRGIRGLLELRGGVTGLRQRTCDELAESDLEGPGSEQGSLELKHLRHESSKHE